MSLRVAASLAAAALLCSCSAPKTGAGGGTSAASAAPAAGATAAARAPAGPANALVSALGRADSVPLDSAQRHELDAAVAKAPAALRPRLRYALATADDGRRHLVVYDGEGLRADGRRPGKTNAYIVFRILNSVTGEHYDPQQNAIVARMPPPPQRDTAPGGP
jgi:hypothetical protein